MHYRPSIHHNQEFADKSLTRIRQLLLDGHTYEAIARVLNAEGYKTIRGHRWTAESIRQLMCTLRKQKRSWYGLAAKRANLAVSNAPN